MLRPSFKPQFYQNKMYTGKSMDFQHDYVDMSQSIEYSQVEMGGESPIYARGHLPAFRTFPKIIPNYASEGDLFEAMSIEQDLLAHPHHPSGYKCYRCFGTNRDVSVLNGEAAVCPECDGTEYVPASNGLASILERLLTLKLPHLANRNEQPSRRSKECLLNYGSQRSIQEQSFSYLDETMRECSSCLREGEGSRMFSCTTCPGFFLCRVCHDRKKYSHPSSHELTLHGLDKISVRLISNPITMKKISQEVESQEMSNCMDSSQLQVKCFSCNHFIEECYMVCLNCEAEGSQYFLCSECSRDAAFIHDPSHKLDLKAVPQASRLMMSAKPSASESQITQPTPSKSKFKSKIKVQDSLVIFDHQLNLDDDDAVPVIVMPEDEGSPFAAPCEEYLRNSNNSNACEDLFSKMSVEPQVREACAQEGEDLTHLLVKKKRRRIQESVVNIDMQTSIEVPSEQKQEQFQPTIAPYAFSTVSNQIVTQHSIQTNPQQYIFNDYECDICKTTPIRNKRYHCRQCENYDLCESCFTIRSKRHEHRNYQMVDGLQIIKKSRESIMKLEQAKGKLSMSRMSQSRLSHSRARTENRI